MLARSDYLMMLCVASAEIEQVEFEDQMDLAAWIVEREIDVIQQSTREKLIDRMCKITYGGFEGWSVHPTKETRLAKWMSSKGFQLFVGRHDFEKSSCYGYLAEELLTKIVDGFVFLKTGVTPTG